MRYLIHLIAEALARTIEAGSLIGAFVASGIAIAASWTTVYLLHRWQMLDHYWIPSGIVLSILTAIIAALIGSLYGPREATTLNNESGALLTNLNYALVPCVAFVLLSGFSCIIFVGQWKTGKLDPISLLVLPSAAIGCGIQSCRMTFAIRIGHDITVRRLLRSHHFPREQIISWGFEVERGTYVQVAPQMPTTFMLKLSDGYTFRADVSAAKAMQLAAAFFGTIEASRAGTSQL